MSGNSDCSALQTAPMVSDFCAAGAGGAVACSLAAAGAGSGTRSGDVTVSREHATLVRRGGDWYLDDSGSLNGTYVNRQRVDSHRLEDGDELQIGKYKLSYLVR